MTIGRIGVQSFWDPDEQEQQAAEQEQQVPAAIVRLHNPDPTRITGTGTGTNHETTPTAPAANIVETSNTITLVRSMRLSDFRSKLVAHFNIAYERNEVIWPKRFGKRVEQPAAEP